MPDDRVRTLMLRVAEHYEKSDTGRQRRVNEDSYFARSPLFVVADGMGGAQAGEVASSTAVSVFEPDLGLAGRSAEEGLAERVRAANARIHELSRTHADQAGMGTTLTALYAGEGEVSIAHVGDSRAYLLRDGRLSKLTDDHSLVDELVKRGELTPEEAEDHPQRSVITRALGPEPNVEVDTITVPARAGDVYLVCSDGLTGMVPTPELERILLEARTLEAAGRAMVAAANAAGGRDNITVVLFRLEELDGAVPVEAPTEITSGEEVRAALAAERREAPASSSTPAARRPRPAEARRRVNWVRRLAIPFAVLVTLAIVGGGVYFASQSVYFIGTDPQGLVAIYQGLPYDLPLGVHLYTLDYTSGVPAGSVTPVRRHSLLDHHLRSHDDAATLVRALELGQLQGAQ